MFFLNYQLYLRNKDLDLRKDCVCPRMLYDDLYNLCRIQLMTHQVHIGKLQSVKWIGETLVQLAHCCPIDISVLQQCIVVSSKDTFYIQCEFYYIFPSICIVVYSCICHSKALHTQWGPSPYLHHRPSSGHDIYNSIIFNQK